MKINKQNWPLFLAFTAPVLLILLVIGSIYIPNLFKKPQYNFIYSQGSYYRNYAVNSAGQIYRLAGQPNPPIPPPQVSQDYPQLYYYDVTKASSTPISFEQAQSYQLNASMTSPDGYNVGFGSHADGIFPLFISTSPDYNSRFLQGHGSSRKLNLASEPDYYNNYFQFVGWVIK